MPRKPYEQSDKLRGAGGRPSYAGVRRRGGGDFRWRDVDPEELLGCVDVVVAAGDAVIFGSTSDGGAGMVRILAKDDPEAWYPTSAQEAQELLADLRRAASVVLKGLEVLDHPDAKAG